MGWFDERVGDVVVVDSLVDKFLPIWNRDSMIGYPIVCRRFMHF